MGVHSEAARDVILLCHSINKPKFAAVNQHSAGVHQPILSRVFDHEFRFFSCGLAAERELVGGLDLLGHMVADLLDAFSKMLDLF